MHKSPNNIQEIRENMAEAAYTAWIDGKFVPRAVVMVNAMGKTIQTVALVLKAAELNKQGCVINDPILNNSKNLPAPKKP